jgi:hypothetical protein
VLGIASRMGWGLLLIAALPSARTKRRGVDRALGKQSCRADGSGKKERLLRKQQRAVELVYLQSCLGPRETFPSRLKFNK